MATSSETASVAWQKEPKAAELLNRLFLQTVEVTPSNTKRASNQREWQDWCRLNYPPLPPNWTGGYDRWDGSSLPGELVDEGKLLIFMSEVAERPPRSGKRLKVEQKRKVDEAEFADAKSQASFETNLSLRYNTVRQYVSAIRVLYGHQKSLGINPAPEPQGVALKALKNQILRRAHYLGRAELADRGEGTIKDSYSVTQIPDHTIAAWQDRKAIACAFRTNVDFLLGNHMLLRSSNRLPLELPDLFCIALPNEGVRRSNKIPAVKALVVLVDHGKTNQHGRNEYGAALRHRDPLACVVSALAFWFFWRWQIEKEPFPSFAWVREWYHIKIIRQSPKELIQPLSSQTANAWTRKLYERCGIETSKASHAPRVASAQNADLAGVPEASV